MTNLILFVIFIAHIYSHIYKASFDIFFSFARGPRPLRPPSGYASAYIWPIITFSYVRTPWAVVLHPKLKVARSLSDDFSIATCTGGSRKLGVLCSQALTSVIFCQLPNSSIVIWYFTYFLQTSVNSMCENCECKYSSLV